MCGVANQQQKTTFIYTNRNTDWKEIKEIQFGFWDDQQSNEITLQIYPLNNNVLFRFFKIYLTALTNEFFYVKQLATALTVPAPLPPPPPLNNVDPSKIDEIRRTVYVGNLDTTVMI